MVVIGYAFVCLASPSLVVSNTAKNNRLHRSLTDEPPPPRHLAKGEFVECHALSVHVELVEWASARAGPLPSPRASFRQEVGLTTRRAT
jgi:hypothetical protein